MGPLAFLLIVLAIIAGTVIAIYNRLIKLQNNREQAFADIDVQLKQRHDLIPQLVDTVKGYMKHEKTVLSDITNARAHALEAKGIDDKITAEAKLTTALHGLQIAVEAYPDLKADKNFMQLQEEIADIENKLAAARRFFNSTTKELNNAIETFPSNIIANMFNFKEAKMFELGEGRTDLEKAPKINMENA